MKPEKEAIRYGLTPAMLTALGPVVIIAVGAAVTPLVLGLLSLFSKN